MTFVQNDMENTNLICLPQSKWQGSFILGLSLPGVLGEDMLHLIREFLSTKMHSMFTHS